MGEGAVTYPKIIPGVKFQIKAIYAFLDLTPALNIPGTRNNLQMCQLRKLELA